MIKLPFVDRPNRSVYLAFSGGVDSVVLLHILTKRGFDVTLLNINHLNQWSDVERNFTIKTSEQYNIPAVYKSIEPRSSESKTSLESYWSTQRNKIFQSMDKMVLTGHHLDDAVEWYLMSTMTGTVKILSARNNNVFRPMIVNTKERILEVAKESNLSYLTDPTNDDVNFNLRNNVRKNLVPSVKQCFPGVYTTVRRLVVQKYKENLSHEEDRKTPF